MVAIVVVLTTAANWGTWQLEPVAPCEGSQNVHVWLFPVVTALTFGFVEVFATCHSRAGIPTPGEARLGREMF